jgi:hypothetical protein
MQVIRFKQPLFVLLVSVWLTGCGFLNRGLLYTDITQPLCKDARGVALGRLSAAGSSKRIEIPTTRVDFTAEWDSRAIGDIAKEHGINQVNYCDWRRESYVLGIWRRDEVIIYGD